MAIRQYARLLVVLAMLSPPAVLAQAPDRAAQDGPRRLALLIGNKQYRPEVGPLANPHNDIERVQRSLEELGFEVTPLRDLGYKEMEVALKQYAAKLSDAGDGAISFFYYTGHGAADPRGTNYIIPVDVLTASDASLWDHSKSQADIINQLKQAASSARHFIVFDACRDELRLPAAAKTLGTAKGFAPVNHSGSVVIAYAADVGQTATDSGAYSRALAAELLKPGVEVVSMFRNVAVRVQQETANRQNPWLSASAMPMVYLSDPPAPPPPPSSDGASFFGIFGGPDKPKPPLPAPAFVELEVMDVDYYPPLKGFWGNSNKIALRFERDGERQQTTIESSGRSRSLPFRYTAAEAVVSQIVELATMTRPEITDHQYLLLGELNKTQTLAYRIRDNTFLDNANLDKNRKTISLMVRLVAFDPEGKSGADQAIAGALAVGAGDPLDDTVAFVAGDATDYAKVMSGKGTCVVELRPMLENGSFLAPAQGVVVAVAGSQPRPRFTELNVLTNTSVLLAPCDAGPAATVFRIVASPTFGAAAYRVTVIRDDARTTDFLRLMDETLSQPLAGYAPDLHAGSEDVIRVARNVTALRQALRIEDATTLVQQLERFIAKGSGGLFSGSGKAPARFAIATALLETDADFYRAAAEASPVLRSHFALQQAEAGKPFDEGAVLAALKSEHDYLAVRAVRVVSKLADRGLARSTLTALLGDRRNDIALTARDELLKLDDPSKLVQPPSPVSNDR